MTLEYPEDVFEYDPEDEDWFDDELWDELDPYDDRDIFWDIGSD